MCAFQKDKPYVPARDIRLFCLTSEVGMKMLTKIVLDFNKNSSFSVNPTESVDCSHLIQNKGVCNGQTANS